MKALAERPMAARRRFPGLLAFPPASGALHSIAARTGAWLERSRQRHALSLLDSRLLKDIGLTREQAGKECGKWFWQA